MRFSLLAALSCLAAVHAWLPANKGLFGKNTTVAGNGTYRAEHSRLAHSNFTTTTTSKLRGVNLGSLFIVEPWMAGTSWSNMGCGSYPDEFHCVQGLDQSTANVAFQKHWAAYITEDDFSAMASYGINTVRIPLGFWIVESLVSEGEYYPQGGMSHLDAVVGWAKARNIYVILDLHGAPKAQAVNQAFTGLSTPKPGFYQDSEYTRAYGFLKNMTNRIHTNPAYSTVGMLEVLNEPIAGQESLASTYYPTAYSTIRSEESSLKVPSTSQLHVQFMDKNWGAGDPLNSLSKNATSVATDDHHYLKWNTSIAKTQDGYHKASCTDNLNYSNEDSVVVVGEWSISVADDVQSQDAFQVNTDANKAWYTKWWAAQVVAYEKQAGWVFWSWKAELGNDYRWGYKNAVEAGVIPKDPGQAGSLAQC